MESSKGDDVLVAETTCVWLSLARGAGVSVDVTVGASVALDDCVSVRVGVSVAELLALGSCEADEERVCNCDDVLLRLADFVSLGVVDCD